MSKAVRIREHLYAEIASLAKTEHRSLIAQLEVLLEQALRMEPMTTEQRFIEKIDRHLEREGLLTPTDDAHFKPDPK